MEWFIITAYCLCLLFIFVFSMGQLHLGLMYWRSKSNAPQKKDMDFEPKVTVQLPVYNEKYVIERLVDSMCALDYPKDKLEIQVLDDSTDETIEIIENKVSHYQSKGFNIQRITRKERSGFKAGALAHGTQISNGEFMAIFDADFMPKPSFLRETLQRFTDENIGCVQTRWGHLNEDYSVLTKLQAFGLNAHFTVEQSGRNHSNSFINFNGTAGVWRKACILDAGGWSADTLTEDLDLSYRAQLRGWKFEYAENVEAPAELPVVMPAIKSQQYRWNKGAAETARKMLWQVITSPKSLKTKVHATLHLLNSSVFLFLLLGALLSFPVILIPQEHPAFNLLFNLGQVFVFGFFAISLFYWTSVRAIKKQPGAYFIRNFPLFLLYSMGLSLHNAIAVAEGWLGRKTPFIRTPKFNVNKKGDRWQSNQYLKSHLTWPTILEGALMMYFSAGVGIGVFNENYILVSFHAMLAVGFGIVFTYSIRAQQSA